MPLSKASVDTHAPQPSAAEIRAAYKAGWNARTNEPRAGEGGSNGEDDQKSKQPKNQTSTSSTSTTSTSSTPSMSIKEAEYALPKMRIHSWSLLVMDRRLYFQCIFMESMLLLWVGRKQPQMGQLCLALNTPFDSVPSATALVGQSDGFSLSLSQKIASRSRLTVFVSLNTEPAGSSRARDTITEAIIEKEVFKELGQQPEWKAASA